MTAMYKNHRITINLYDLSDITTGVALQNWCGFADFKIASYTALLSNTFLPSLASSCSLVSSSSFLELEKCTYVAARVPVHYFLET